MAIMVVEEKVDRFFYFIAEATDQNQRKESFTRSGRVMRFLRRRRM